jgi:hypothetical protein
VARRGLTGGRMVVYQSVSDALSLPSEATLSRLSTARRKSPVADDKGADWDRDAASREHGGTRFHVVCMAGRGPFRYAVLDSMGGVRDRFRGRRSVEHAARMLALGAGYDPHALVGARVVPILTPPHGEHPSEADPADYVLSEAT